MAVVIETTIGDFTIDLFTEERPQTCKNFLKLCKIKYYNFCLFHSIQPNFLAQTGDPSGLGTGGESVFGIVYGENARYYEGEKMPKIEHTKPGLLSMVNCGNNMLGSQFFVTLGSELQSLDEHCVFAEIAEGMDILLKLNETICDNQHRPYQDIRITHTVILHDPFEDLSGLVIPDASPQQSQQALDNGRIGADEEIDDTAGLTAVEVEEMKKEREAKARATILEIVGDLPDAEMAPPENVLFVCKLNPVTNDDDLEIIFSRFGKVKSCEVIRDQETGDSLQYAFVEFEDKKACEEAYFKMDNVLIDDRRIHVDFSQSVAKMRWRGKGRGVEHFDKGNRKENDRQTRKDDSRRDSKTDPRRESKPDSKKESKPESRRESKPDSRKESRSDSRKELKTDSRKESRSDSRKESRSDSRNSDFRVKDENDARREDSYDSSRQSKKKDFEDKTTDDTRRKEIDERKDSSRNGKDLRDEKRSRRMDDSSGDGRSDIRMESYNREKRERMRMEGSNRNEKRHMRIDGNSRDERREMRMDDSSAVDRRDFRLGGSSREGRRDVRMEGNIRSRNHQQTDDNRRDDGRYNYSQSSRDPVTGEEWAEPFRVVDQEHFHAGIDWEEPFVTGESRRNYYQEREFDAGNRRMKDRYDRGEHVYLIENVNHNSGPSERFRSEEMSEWNYERRVEKLEVEHSRNGLEKSGKQSSREVRPRGSSSSHTASPMSASRSRKERSRNDSSSPMAKTYSRNSGAAIEQKITSVATDTESPAKSKDKGAKKRKGEEEEKPVKQKKKKKYSSSSNSDSSASSDESSNSDSSSSDSESTSRKRKGKVRTTIAKKYYHKGKLVKIVKKKKDTSTDSDSDDSSESDGKKKKHKKKGRAKKIVKIIEKKKKRKHDSSDDSDSESSTSSSSSSSSTSSSEESDSDSGSQKKKRKMDAKKKQKKKKEKIEKKKKTKLDSGEVVNLEKSKKSSN